MDNGPTKSDTPDALLVGMAREGDRVAWGVLAARHYEALFRWLWRMCGRHEVAEDLAQDAFLRASTRLELFREGAVAFEQAAPLADLLVRWTGDETSQIEVSEEFDEPAEGQVDANSSSAAIEGDQEVQVP